MASSVHQVVRLNESVGEKTVINRQFLLGSRKQLSEIP